MPALCWHLRDAGHPRPDPAHLCGRSFAKTRIGWSIGNRRSVFGRPPRRRRAANCRRLGRLAFVAGERARQLPRLGDDPGAARRLWAGACRRGTGVAGGIRVQPALQRPRDPRGSPARPGRHEPAEPNYRYTRVGQQRAGSGGEGYSRGSPPSRRRDATSDPPSGWPGNIFTAACVSKAIPRQDRRADTGVAGDVEIGAGQRHDLVLRREHPRQRPAELPARCRRPWRCAAAARSATRATGRARPVARATCSPGRS